jgi:hypothetical protein
MKRLLSPVFLVSLLTLTLAAVAALPAQAQQSERFGNYELHYSVLNSTFISPEVAAQYGITRGERRGLINIALREHLADGTAVNRAMILDAESWDLTGRRDPFDFIEIREGPAVYYIGEFKFLNREWRHFRVAFTPENGDQTFEVRFKRQLYTEQ